MAPRPPFVFWLLLVSVCIWRCEFCCASENIMLWDWRGIAVWSCWRRDFWPTVERAFDERIRYNLLGVFMGYNYT